MQRKHHGNPGFLPLHTDDDFERNFQVNYLSHLSLVEQLFPLLNSGRVVVTASRMSLSTCEWRQYAANFTALCELPAEARLELWTDQVPGGLHGSRAGQMSSRCASVFVAPRLRHRHREGISARVDVESRFSLELDQFPSFHGGGRSHPGWRSR